MTGRGAGFVDDEEDDLAPPSIWDAEEDGDALDPVRLIDPDVSPVDPIPRSGQSGPEAWLEAEAARALPPAEAAEAAEAFARLDERLRAWDPTQARAGVERLALGQAAALLWAEGAAIEVERLSL
jgi:hypothetical protein